VAEVVEYLPSKHEAKKKLREVQKVLRKGVQEKTNEVDLIE
jgi:hypothetical protein